MNSSDRVRNRRGEGGRLRAEIVAAAAELAEQAGTPEAITLRAVARQAGISAPSIYAHFADRAAIAEAVVDGAFGDFNAAISAAMGGPEQPPEVRLRAGCAAYLQFAAEHPNRYRLLFEQSMRTPGGGGRPLYTESFDLLVRTLAECADAGISASTDPFGDATSIWVGLHGYATLRTWLPGFPWPDAGQMLDRLVYGPARIARNAPGA